MAKKKPNPQRSPPLKPLRPKEVEVVDPGSRKRPTERAAKPKKEKAPPAEVKKAGKPAREAKPAPGRGAGAAKKKTSMPKKIGGS